MKHKWLLRWGAVAAGALFTGLGAVRGEPLEVMRKAVQICLECIGIG